MYRKRNKQFDHHLLKNALYGVGLFSIQADPVRSGDELYISRPCKEWNFPHADTERNAAVRYTCRQFQYGCPLHNQTL